MSLDWSAWASHEYFIECCFKRASEAFWIPVPATEGSRGMTAEALGIEIRRVHKLEPTAFIVRVADPITTRIYKGKHWIHAGQAVLVWLQPPEAR
jgi:hypothetical protein